MTEVAVYAAMLQAFVFFAYDLVSKRLGERGVGPAGLVRAQSGALAPSAALLALGLAFDRGSAAMLAQPRVLGTLFAFVGVGVCFQFLYFRCQRIAHSLTVISVVRNAVSFPLLMAAGFLINGDRPTPPGLLSLALLVLAVFIRPGRSGGDARQLIDAPAVAVGLSALFVLLVTIKDPLYRLYLTSLSQHPWTAIGAYLTLASLLFKLYFVFARREDAAVSSPPAGSRPAALLYAVPALWLLGSIPEALAFRGLPVFQMVAIGTISWTITLVSDVGLGRLAVDARTAVFSACVLGSVALNVADKLSHPS